MLTLTKVAVKVRFNEIWIFFFFFFKGVCVGGVGEGVLRLSTEGYKKLYTPFSQHIWYMAHDKSPHAPRIIPDYSVQGNGLSCYQNLTSELPSFDKDCGCVSSTQKYIGKRTIISHTSSLHAEIMEFILRNNAPFENCVGHECL